MMSWLATAGADSAIDAGTPVSRGTATEIDNISQELEPLDYRIITLLFEGTKPGTIMAALQLTPDEFDARVGRQSFTDLERRIETAMLEKITGRGDFEPTSAAKAEAPHAMARIIKQSRSERDPKTRLAANEKVLKFAGVEPARRVEVSTPDQILDQMTPEELALFAAHRKWPSRFKEALRAYIPADSDGSKLEAIDAIVDEPPKKALPPPDQDALPASSLPPPE